MNAQTTTWTRRYRTALRRFLRQGPPAGTAAAERLGALAAELGLETLAVADIHEQTLNAMTTSGESSPDARRDLVERADAFFKETIVPIEATHLAARLARSRIEQLTRTLRQRTGESSSSTEQLQQAIVQRQSAEADSHQQEARHDELFADAQRTQNCLRHLMRAILAEHEGERRHIGTKLRDEIAQSLLAIDISLLALGASSKRSAHNAAKSVANAQRILEEFRTRDRLTGDR